MEASSTTKDATPKVEDMTFLFLLLNAHKQGAWKFQLCADKLSLPSAKAAESKYYRLKKLYFDSVGGGEMMEGITQAGETPKKDKKAANATPKGKKGELETDGDDEETPVATVKGKGKGGGKKVKVEVEAGEGEEVAAKAEPEEGHL
ncbi:hypothetical protein LTR56_005190 [Elasticomyces elasticus]|nr:hypothetical protein LTR56_005190 [Elasticomyces elasticus]KAK3659646.1 hypothetical protein LTR22_008377 [Elasticomyces elasticus]KAK4916869.1 hypothetical protein LTR49_015181 [Elasticomyces elasticus]KAK5759640.1 hypothetical protein LTS12_010156 [Elasticomyces elasticus]